MKRAAIASASESYSAAFRARLEVATAGDASDDEMGDGVDGADVAVCHAPLRWAWVSSAHLAPRAPRCLLAAIDVDTCLVLSLALVDASATTSQSFLDCSRATAFSAAYNLLSAAAGPEPLFLNPTWLTSPPPLVIETFTRLVRALLSELCPSGDVDTLHRMLSSTGAGPGGFSPRERGPIEASLAATQHAWNATPLGSVGLVRAPTAFDWKTVGAMISSKVGLGASCTVSAHSDKGYAAASDGYDVSSCGTPSPRGGGLLPTDTPISAALRRLRGDERASLSLFS